MSYYEKEYKRRLSLGQDGNALVMLIAINLVIFVLFAFVKVIYYFSYDQPGADVNFGNDIYNNIALPASLSELIRKPWTLITHMFYHYNVWHIISNMLWLWAFGYIFQDLTGSSPSITTKLLKAFLKANIIRLRQGNRSLEWV